MLESDLSFRKITVGSNVGETHLCVPCSDVPLKRLSGPPLAACRSGVPQGAL